jgi:hypothetical protein
LQGKKAITRFAVLLLTMTIPAFASGQNYFSFHVSNDSIMMKHLHHVADSILIAKVGERDFKLFYVFSEEESLVDSAGYAVRWNERGIEKGESFELNYKFRSDFNTNGIFVYLWRNGKQKFPVSVLGVIPNLANGKPPEVISRKEAFSIARKYGMKDTFALEYLMKVDSTGGKYVYRLQIEFRVPAKRADDEERSDYYYGVKTITVNPWTKKVIRCRHEDFLLEKPQV